MDTIKATWKNGQIVPDSAIPWREGSRLLIQEEPVTEHAEDDQEDTPESIARWIAAFDAIPPAQMTPEEEAQWQAARNAQRKFELATFDDRVEDWTK